MAMTTLSFSLPLDSPQPLFLKSNNTTYLNNSINSSSRSSNSRPLSVSFTPSSSYHPLYSIIPSSSSHSSSSGTHLNNPLTGGRFLDEKDLEKIETLKNFMYTRKINGGSLKVRVMEDEEIDVIVRLLAESFAESMSVPWRFVTFLGFLVKQYVRERRVLLPHAATLVGLYEGEDGKAELAGTVEISFDKQGANASPPTPVPPMECPYICNMAVKKQLRRRGIGRHLLRASEELISLMAIPREVYLHCRMIDKVPLNMYKNAGYNIISTDSIFTLFTFQRRKHLMCKKLPEPNNLHLDIVGAGVKPAS